MFCISRCVCIVFLWVCVCMCICLCVCVFCVYVSIYVACMFVGTYVYMRVYISACVCICLFVSVYTYVCVCVLPCRPVKAKAWIGRSENNFAFSYYLLYCGFWEWNYGNHALQQILLLAKPFLWPLHQILIVKSCVTFRSVRNKHMHFEI